jgi:DNA mismatch endonuclease (patch repair protein)
MDNITADQRKKAMRGVKSKHTKPELAVRRLLTKLGYKGYRLHNGKVVGKPDIAWIGKKRAIFVHGCFWHRHSCKRGDRSPTTHADYWRQKIDRNVERDFRHMEELRNNGWTVLVIWECELGAPLQVEQSLHEFLT